MKKPITLEPRSLFDALLGPDSPLPGFAPEETARARALARDPSSAASSEIESLPEPLALALLEGSVRARIPALPDALSRSHHKNLVKAAKKALYRLRSLGVAVPEQEMASAPAPAPSAPLDDLPSLLSSVSGSGEEAVIVPRALRGGGLEILQFVLSDEKGIVHLARSEVSRSAYRKQLKEIRGGATAPAIEVPLDQARRILSAASGRNLESGSDYPAESDEALRHLGVTPGKDEDAVSAPEPGDERLATEAAQLHAEPEVQPWLPPEPQLRFLVAKSDEIMHSPLQLTDAQKSEQLVHQFRTAARSFFTPEVQHLYGRRLWRMANFFERTGRERQASIARAEARRLFHHFSEPFSRFAEFLFEKVLLLSQRARSEAPAAHTSNPPEPSAPAEHRSPGGLILP